MMRKILAAMGVLMFMGAAAQAAPKENDWAYPLDIKAGLSSNFGEFRGNRVHTGIDFRTNMETGHKVFAIDGGAITRLSVKKLGFGNAIYITHPNGMMSVYGHLERFSDKEIGLQTLIEQQKRRRGTKYPGDIAVNIPVKKGQLIAYSGESGYGLPHLHLEVRRGGATPIDPFEHGFSYDDRIPPTIESLSIEPLGAESFVNGEHHFQEFPLQKEADRFVNRQVPKVFGKVRFTASAFDQIGAENRCAVDEIDLYIAAGGVDQVDLAIDEARFFHNQFDQVTYDTNHRGGLVYDYNLTRLSNPTHYYYRLYNLSPAHFPYRKVFAENGGVWDTASVAEGRHTLLLEIRDATGNVSVGQMDVDVARDPTATFAQAAPRLPKGKAWFAELREFQGFVEVALISNAALQGEPTLEIRPQKGAAVTVPMTRKSAGAFSGVYHLPKSSQTLTIALNAVLQNGEAIAQAWEFPAQFIAAKQGGAARFGDKAVMSFPAGALYENIFANIWPTTDFEAQDGLPLKSEVYDFRPAGAPLEKKGLVSIRYAADVKNLQTLGVYWWDSLKRQWYYMDDKLDAKRGMVSAEIIYPSIYAVLQDNAKPVISEMSADAGNASAVIKDVGKGVDEASIVMTLDGKRVDGEYDPDRDKYTAQLTKKLAPGKHTLKVQASDKAGNPAKSQTVTLMIK